MTKGRGEIKLMKTDLFKIKNDTVNFKSTKTAPNAQNNALSFLGQGLKLSVLSEDKISFKGYCASVEDVGKKGNLGDFGWKTEDGKYHLYHTTCFFRNPDTLKFVRDEVKKRFPKGAEIWDYGCSNGKEPLSLLMLLNPDPDKIDKSYKVKAFDLSEDIINQAKVGLYSIFESSEKFDEWYIYDMYLTKKDCELTEDQKEQKKAFDKYFVKIEKPANVSLSYNKKPKEGTKEVFVTLNDNLKNDLNDVLEYQGGEEVGNVANVSKRENKAGAIIFKNGWYHLTGNGTYPVDDRTRTINELKFEVVEQTVKDMYEKLEDNGILVVGNDCFDQLFYKDPKNKDLDSIESHPVYKDPDNPHLELVKVSPFQEILKRNGFEPIKWEPATGLPYLAKQDVLVPSVWQKVKKS